MTIKIYIEGGGEGKDLDSRFREAWTRFFTAAGLAGRRFGRSHAPPGPWQGQDPHIRPFFYGRSQQQS